MKKFLFITLSLLFLFLNINVIANAASYSTPSNDTLSDKATNTYTVIFNSNG
nr:hypothetical protein [Clostridium sp.]